MVSNYLINRKHKVGFYVGCIDNTDASDEDTLNAIEQLMCYKEYCSNERIPMSSDVVNYLLRHCDEAPGLRMLFVQYMYNRMDGDWEVVEESEEILSKIKILD
jgi:hypothetical protein